MMFHAAYGSSGGLLQTQKSRNQGFTIWIAACCLIWAAPGLAIGAQPAPATTTVSFLNADGKRITAIRAEVADTPSAHQTGLMGRTELSPDAGMLFVYPDAAERVYWMRNTPLPLDIIYVSDTGRIHRIVRGAEPLSDRHYPSEGPVRLVVEVNAGFVDTWGIETGMVIQWDR